MRNTSLFPKEDIMNTLNILKKILICSMAFLIIFSSRSDVRAQEPDLIFDRMFDLGSPGGQTMLQDNDGLLWIGTEGGGIFRYDGYEFKNYKAGSGSLSNGTIWRIIQDVENPDIFWIGTSGGLNRFDKATETFTYYKHDPGILWITTYSGNVDKYDAKSQNFTLSQHNSNDPNSLSDSVVTVMLEGGDGTIWIGTQGGGLNAFDRTTGVFTRYQHNPDDPESLDKDYVLGTRIKINIPIHPAISL